MFKRVILSLTILIIFVSFSFPKGTRIAIIPWGTDATQLGLQSGPEIEPVGPLSFAMDSSNSIYFLDTINQRVSVFDSKGKFQKIVAEDVNGSSIAVDANSAVGLLNGTGLNIINQQGNTQKIQISPSDDIVEGYGQHLRTSHNEITLQEGNIIFKHQYNSFYITKINQHILKVAESMKGIVLPSGKTTIREYDPKLNHERVSERLGIPMQIGQYEYFLTTEWKNNQLAVVKSSSGAEYPLTTNDAFGGLQIIGVDVSGNIYVEAERITSDNYVHLDIWKLNTDGKVIGTQEIPNNYATTVYKKTELASDGSITQVVTTKEGVEIWKWEF